MTTTETWDVFEWLAQKTGKNAAELYAEQGATAFADLGAEYLPKGTKILYDVAGEPFMVINNATGEVIYKTASDAVNTTAGVYATQSVAGANAVTTVETVTGETGALTSTLTSGANTAATTVAGKAGATIAGITMKDAVFGGLAVLGGVAQGVKWYNDNPEFWTHLSKALLPFAYGDSYKNSGDELASAMNALIPTTVDGNGNTYLPENFLNALAQELVNENAFSKSYTNPSYNDDSIGTQLVINSSSRITKSLLYEVSEKLRTTWNIYHESSYKFIGDNIDALFNSIDAVDYNTFFFTMSSGYGGLASTFTLIKYDDSTTGTIYKKNNSIQEFNKAILTKYGHYIASFSNPITCTRVSFNPPTGYIYTNTISTYNFDLSNYNSIWTEQKYVPDLLNKIEQISYSGINLIEKNNIDGISSSDGSVLPSSDKSLQDTYPDWFNKALQTVDPKSTPQNVTYNYWLPVSIPTTDPTQKEGDTTATQTQAQTGENPKDNTNVINKLVTAIKQLTETMTKPDGDTPILPPTDTPTPTDTGDTPQSIPPVTSGSANGLWKVYNPSEGQLQAFGAWLWSSDIVDQIVKMISNPMNAIIGLHTLYATPVTGAAQSIKAGYLDSGVSAPVVTNQYTSIDCGSVIVPEAYKNALDYDYTNVSVYLPFIGIVPLNTREVMGSKISIRYRVDVLTGTCLATISVSRQSSNAVLYTFSGNCAVQIPLTSGNYGTLLTGLLSAVGGVATSVATGGAALPSVAGVGSAIINARTNVSRTGNLGSNAGALGVRIPYVIITRPIAYDANNYSIYYGYPANKTVTLSSLTGFTRIKSVHVENIPATEEEKNMIDSALKNGVIL